MVGEDFERWLGHLRRLPRTEGLESPPCLDEAATAEQVAALLDTAPSPRLATLVFERSRGNPYLSELLVRRLDQDATHLPEELPEELSQALLDAWRGIFFGPGARGDPRTGRRGTADRRSIAGRDRFGAQCHHGRCSAGSRGGRGPRPRRSRGVVPAPAARGGAAGVLTCRVRTRPCMTAWGSLTLETTSSQGVDELRRLGRPRRAPQRGGGASAGVRSLVAAAESLLNSCVRLGRGQTCSCAP